MYNRNETLSGAEARAFLRNWLRENGVASKLADSLTMSELNAAWLDQSNETLQSLWDRPEKAPSLPSVPAAAGNETAAALMLQALSLVQGNTKQTLDEDRVIQLIRENSQPRDVRYTFTLQAGKEVKTERREHAFFPVVMACLQTGTHMWLVGPAGSGKTSLVGSAAALLGKEHRAVSVCAQTTKTDLLGFIDANGVYRSTAFREAFERGFVFLLDEADNGNANVLAVLNAALANGEMTFPDKTVKKGEGFVCVACANTWGTGASAGYVGRNQIDAATLDRFFFLELPLDRGLEASFLGFDDIASPVFDLSEGGIPSKRDWLESVYLARDNAERFQLKVMIGTRAVIMGAALAALGVGRRWLNAGLLFKSLEKTSQAKLLQASA
jgi:energy-coupling factor transporter ATP-binding protein EcfA2